MGIREVLTDITRDVMRNGREADENKRMITNAPFLAGRASVKTIAGGVIEVTRPHVVVLPESGIADNLDEITNYADGKFIIVSPADPAHTITVRDESISGGNIRLTGGATTLALSGPEETILLIYKDEVALWVQTGGAASGGTPGAHAASHQHGGSDEVATSTPAGNAIVKADADGKIGAGWIDDIDINLDNVTEGATNKFYTATEKTKLAGIAAGAEVNVNADWNAVSGDAEILNKPTIPTQYTDEMARDAVGPMMTDSATIDFTFDDPTDTITAIVKDDSITFAKMQNIAVDNLLGRSTSGTGDIELIVLTAFARSIIDDVDAAAVRTTLGLGTIATEAETNYVLVAGTRILTGDWDIGEDRRILAEALRARDSEGIVLETDDGLVRLSILDDGTTKLRRSTEGMILDVGPLAITESATVYGTGFLRTTADNVVSFNMVRLAAANAMMGGGVDGDTFRRLIIQADGLFAWGSGSAARDISLGRSALLSGTLLVTSATIAELVRFAGTIGASSGVQGEILIGFDARSDATTTPGAGIYATEFDASDNRHTLSLAVKMANDSTTPPTKILTIKGDNGFVGIGPGLVNPLSTVHIKASLTGLTTPTRIRVENDQATGYAVMQTMNDAGHVFQFQMFGSVFTNGNTFGVLRDGRAFLFHDGTVGMAIGASTNIELFFATNDLRRMTILSTGAVAIATATPGAQLGISQVLTTGNALRVIRDLAAASTDSPVVDIIDDHSGDDQGLIRLQQDGTGYIVEAYDGATLVWRINDGGRVDIAQIIRALTASGLRLEDDGGISALEVADGGGVHTPVSLTTKPGTASDTARVGGVMYVSTTAAGNVGTGDDDLASYTIPANTLAVNNQSVWMKASGKCANNVNAKRIRVKFGTAGNHLVLDYDRFNVSKAIDWTLEAHIYRTGAATQKAHITLTVHDEDSLSNYGRVKVTTNLDQTLSGAIDFKVTGEATSNNDITIETVKIGWDGENT